MQYNNLYKHTYIITTYTIQKNNVNKIRTHTYTHNNRIILITKRQKISLYILCKVTKSNMALDAQWQRIPPLGSCSYDRKMSV